MNEHYEEQDNVLPVLTLDNPCTIYIDIDDDSVFLQVGQRDWQWDRKTGKLNGAGTVLDSGVPDGGGPEMA